MAGARKREHPPEEYGMADFGGNLRRVRNRNPAGNDGDRQLPEFHRESRKPAPGKRLDLRDAVILRKKRAARALAKAYGKKVRRSSPNAALKSLAIAQSAPSDAPLRP